MRMLHRPPANWKANNFAARTTNRRRTGRLDNAATSPLPFQLTTLFTALPRRMSHASTVKPGTFLPAASNSFEAQGSIRRALHPAVRHAIATDRHLDVQQRRVVVIARHRIFRVVAEGDRKLPAGHGDALLAPDEKRFRAQRLVGPRLHDVRRLDAADFAQRIPCPRDRFGSPFCV
jgi:hypothetical protein